jgi:SAM-dependent methyltransferase
LENKIDKLRQLYANTSKHSNYQILAKDLKSLIPNNDVIVRSRFEEERLKYMLSLMQFEGKKILDIGGNTGFFSFELIKKGALSVVYYEGNKAHAEFVKEASALLKYDDKIAVFDRYLSFESELENESFDIVLLLNVLHHVGDDFGDKSLSIDRAKEAILNTLNYLAYKTKYLFFQLGFCWRGDREKLLFKDGTKKEMIDFVVNGTNHNWEIVDIAVPELIDGQISYTSLNDRNIVRNDSLGEFLNRPIFALKTKLYY